MPTSSRSTRSRSKAAQGTQLQWAGCGLEDQQLEDMLKKRRVREELLSVNLSRNSLTASGLQSFLSSINFRKLREVRLFKNNLCDAAAEPLADLCTLSPQLQEVHLSHNLLTAQGCDHVVRAVADVKRPHDMIPLWLRLEWNYVDEPKSLLGRWTRSGLPVCAVPDGCTRLSCLHRKQIQVPHFTSQYPSWKASCAADKVDFVIDVEEHAEADEAAGPPLASKINEKTPLVSTLPAKPPPEPWLPQLTTEERWLPQPTTEAVCWPPAVATAAWPNDWNLNLQVEEMMEEEDDEVETWEDDDDDEEVATEACSSIDFLDDDEVDAPWDREIELNDLGTESRVWKGIRAVMTAASMMRAALKTCTPSIVFKGNGLLVLFKPPSCICSESYPLEGVAGYARWLGHSLRSPVAMCHRLDMPTSGLMLVGSNHSVTQDLLRQRNAKQWRKEYVCLMHGWLPPDRIEGSLHFKLRTVAERRGFKTSVDEEHGQYAETHYSVLRHYRCWSTGRKFSLLVLRIMTGRTHQIRVHIRQLALQVGMRPCGIVADAKYLKREELLQDVQLFQKVSVKPRLCLHASVLGFRSPVDNETVIVRCGLPDDIRAVIVGELVEDETRACAPGQLACNARWIFKDLEDAGCRQQSADIVRVKEAAPPKAATDGVQRIWSSKASMASAV